MSTTTKAVLLCLQDSATLKVFVLRLYGEVNVAINHVLKLITTSHFAVLCYLTDTDNIDCMFLGVRRK